MAIYTPNQVSEFPKIVNNDLPLFTDNNTAVLLNNGYIVNQQPILINNINVSAISVSYDINDANDDFLYATTLITFVDGSIIRVLTSYNNVMDGLFRIV